MTWKKNKINIAIQVLPEAEGKLKYSLVDGAIAVVQNSGFKFRVCPFETVVECTFEEFEDLLVNIHQACKNAGTEKMITNMKIQVDFKENVTIEDKMNKYS